MEKASGNLFTPIVNHLKSKGSACGDGDDDTTTDGQGNCTSPVPMPQQLWPIGWLLIRPAVVILTSSSSAI